MDFTRQPIIETIITPKEGCKLVVRSSKGIGQEEYFVDAVEVVSFGNSIFFRSLERPKSFLVPANDYEVLEVREARMVFKNVGLERSIKIGGGREAGIKGGKREPHPEKAEKEEPSTGTPTPSLHPEEAPPLTETRQKRDRRRHSRRRKTSKEETPPIPPPTTAEASDPSSGGNPEGNGASFSHLLPPPPTLISDTIARYKENVLFKDAFFPRGNQELEESRSEEYDFSFGLSEEEPQKPIPPPPPPLEKELSSPEENPSSNETDQKEL